VLATAEHVIVLLRATLQWPRPICQWSVVSSGSGRGTLSLDLATLLTGYDLNKPKDYAPLFAAIKSIGGDWWHHLDSTWLIKSESTVARTTPW
jgi:hypothetical protein